ncbi:carboxypeptidase regulatory-like domain-containing protein [Micromonospora violae]|uniref:carboxypeptidase regulatory-like domain-containing protein n=1 Tax=Micromonospora violae TaxID=1278207 RepID=UPI0033C30816
MVGRLRRRQTPRVLLRGLVAAVTLSLLATGPLPVAAAQAAPTPAPSSSADWDALRYTPASCNTATAAEAGTDGPWARCFAVGLSSQDSQRRLKTTSPPPGALGPDDIKSAYRLPSGGDGQTVAIVGAFGYAAAEADLAVFRAHYGLPPCTTANGCFRKVDQYGGTNYPVEDEGWSIEAALDLDAVSSACPKCNILLVQADDNGGENLGRAVDTAARLGAVAISNSYGVPGETYYQGYFAAHYDHPGVVITVASGDIGNVQSYPATHPNVVSVGGTLLTRDPSSPRGWSETAWSAAGSGCSRYEARPAYQADIDTRCDDKRASADISATAAPESGLAVYNTLGQAGWAQWGGTSLAAPLVAAMYALAGDPVPGTYPVTYPYRKDKAAGLFDITQGSNGYCGDLRCNAGPGWDGPTGLGSPNGVSALTLGVAGEVSGTVKSGTNAYGKPEGPLAGVPVIATDSTGATYRAVTDEKGRYRLFAPAGSYDLAATEFGYQAPTSSRVTVAAGTSVTRNLTMTAVETRHLTGVVSDASGHGWPIYAKIAIDGYPGGSVFTDPYTGRYDVELPVGSYTLRVSPVDMPGYVTSTVSATIGAGSSGAASDVRKNVKLAIDASTCAAPGYAWDYQGVSTDFTGWASGPKDGWRVTDESGSGQTWRFDDIGRQGNLTGGTGEFASINTWAQFGNLDSTLVTPSLDLRGITNPVIGFDTDFGSSSYGVQKGFVELSLDNGATWKEAYRFPDVPVRGHLEIPIPQAAGKAGVQARFRYQGSFSYWWQLDNAFVGRRTCAAVPGGIIAGQIRDDNTGGALVGATVSAGTDLAAKATSVDTTDDSALDDGFYWLFAAGDGQVPMTITGLRYADAKGKLKVKADRVVQRDWRLESGRLSVDESELSFSVKPGRSATREVRLTNEGARPLTVRLVEQDRGYTSDAKLVAARSAESPAQQVGDGSAWVTMPDLPMPAADNLVAENDGAVYSVGGSSYEYTLREGWAFDPQARAWKRIADLPEPRTAAVGGFVDGKLYVAGGLSPLGETVTTTYAYDPMTNTWSRRADLPKGTYNGAAVSLDGKLYVVAGCADGRCDPPSQRVYRYDPDVDRWVSLADYPEGVALQACGAIGDGLICAGGYLPARRDATAGAYRYFPESNTWVPTTGLPVSGYGMTAASVNGKLRIMGGIYGSATSAQVRELDPATGLWSRLPDLPHPGARGGAACGTFQVGGLDSEGDLSASVYQLPGGGSCIRGTDVSWLSANKTELTIPAGRTVTVRVSAAVPAIAGNGEHAARLAFETDTPYRTEPVAVVLKTR